MPSVKLSVTIRGALKRKYDRSALKKVDGAVKSWIAADRERDIRTVHVALDDAASMKALGVPAVKDKITAAKVKHAIDSLWKKIVPDYLVLFGGHDVIPQFVVANPSYDPSGDDDKDVPTDNPYASSLPFRPEKRASYLIPDRVLGRIPDMPDDGDPAWLVDYLATAADWSPEKASVYSKAYTICCDSWKRAGSACVEYVGKPASLLLVSPPEVDTSAAAKARLSSRLHMIKCHGAQLDPQFYGQKGNVYPVALSSGTLKPLLKPGTLVAAMCCYGAQVYSPRHPATTVPGAWPLSSTYLRGGTPGFVGSTMIAWVGESEMMCADWIAASYLKAALGGASIGRAFLEAKQDYVRWINQQGRAPDLADEKTLIEFVLLGDPSIQPVIVAAPAVAKARGLTLDPAPALVLQERRQRRVVRAQMAEQMREVLPVRSTAGREAIARSAKIFEAARAILDEDPQTLGLQARAARVERLETKLPTPPAIARRGLTLANAPLPGTRQSIEYYWSGRRILDGHKRIRLVKVETDTEGNVLRSAVVHSS